MSATIGEELMDAGEMIAAAERGTIVVAADGIAWQYDGSFWWPASFQAKRRTDELAYVEGFWPAEVVDVR